MPFPMRIAGLPWALLLALALASGCGKEPEAPSMDPLLLEKDVEVVHDVVVLYSDSTRLRARVSGPRLVKYLLRNEERDEFPNGVDVQFYDGSGRASSRLTADHGVRDPRNRQIRAVGNVVFSNVQGDTLESEELIWVEQEERLFTRKFVMVTTPEEKVWGMGFEANQDFTRRRVNAPQGRVSISSPEQ
jgi:LPS export ABC transporter protein LptC